MTILKQAAAAVAAIALLVGVTACGSEGESTTAPAEQTAANGDVFNDADVEFASAMIPHHAQALAMVDMTRGRDVSPRLRALTRAIEGAQGPEIQQMTGWLTDWDQPVPETMRDHVNSGHGMGEMPEMPGMMTEDQMAELESATGPEFEELWLQMMIEHHEGAIEMAQDQQQDGVFEPAVELAESVEKSQQAEIADMKDLLDS